MFTRPQFRFPPGSDFEALYAEEPTILEDYETFLEREVIADLLALGDRAEVEHQRTQLTHTGPEGDYLMVYYRLSGLTKAGQIDKEIRFVVERLQDEQTGERWRVIADEVVVE